MDDRNLGPSVPEIDSDEASYPEEYDDDDDDDNDDDNNDDDNDDDADESHDENNVNCGGRRRPGRDAWKRHRSDLDFGATYPLANSHGNAYQESSSHSKYTELYSQFRARSDNDATRRELDVGTPYSVANSHGEHGGPASHSIRDRDYRGGPDNDNPTWDAVPCANYEMANSHSNYRVFYDSQTQQHRDAIPPWPGERWPENRRVDESTTTGDRPEDGEDVAKKQNESDKKIVNEQDASGTTCDIEQCLVQIEESLLNIEQNLLHVQDLDIPELRNLLYKSPSIERSLFEVQDILYSDGIAPVISRKSKMSLDSDEGEEEEEEGEEEEEEEEEDEKEKEEEGEEVWVGQSLTVKDNDDEDGDAGAPLLSGSNEESSDTANTDERNPAESTDDDRYYRLDDSNVARETQANTREPQTRPEKIDLNFVPNSLGKTPPRRIVMDEVKENIRLCSSQVEEHVTATIDYNLNSACAEKKAHLRDKWHSRTNSLDENSIFQNAELDGEREKEAGAADKSSLRSVLVEDTACGRALKAGAKARSEGALQTANRNRPVLRPASGRSHGELLQAVEATAQDFRKRLESLASQQRRAAALERQKRTTTSKGAREADDGTATRERSPARSKRAASTAATRAQDKDSCACKSGAGCDKRKRKKPPGKSQSAADNALVPGKLISLSLSLLLAALLQAVRCLTDLVEDAFRSISYDRSGLLQ